jgi:hypothetical protein
MAKTFDPKLYSIVIAGIPIPAKGYADGEFIKIEWDTDGFTDVAGTDGDVTRAKQHDKRATVTFSTMVKAAINAVLSTLYNLDVNSDEDAGVGPFFLNDRSGTTVYESPECWIARMPDPGLDKTPTARQWKVRCSALAGFEGE